MPPRAGAPVLPLEKMTVARSSIAVLPLLPRNFSSKPVGNSAAATVATRLLPLPSDLAMSSSRSLGKSSMDLAVTGLPFLILRL